ncbi:MAG: DUF2182 domain-containing protein, partial [Pseudomonadota bacterium]|nr:DUF2182 domain-containing protein [Pseudomonadota bacterium]
LRGAVAQSTGGMAAMHAAREPQLLATASLLMAMWWTMMTAMMLPSAAPAILLYGRIRARHGARAGIVPSWLFLAGYLSAWLVISVLATMVQMVATATGLLDGMAMRVTAPPLASALLIAAGLYQLTPVKNICLANCRSPASFLANHWQPGVAGALRLGLLHCAYCVGCCWLLMAMLFVGGVMNMLWITALAALVAAEKLAPLRLRLSRLTGVLLIIAGTVRLLL